MRLEDKDVPGPPRDYVGYGRHRPRVVWPDEARVAVNIVVNYEEGSEYSMAAGDGRNEGLAEINYVMPSEFRDLAAEFEAVGAQRVGISMDEVARQATFATNNDLDYPLLSDADGSVAKEFGVKRALNVLKVRRVTFVVGAERRILAVINGEVNMSAHADRALEVLRSVG